MGKNTAVVPFNIQTLPALAKQLQVVIDIDGAKLQVEVEQYTKNIETRSLAAKRLKITDDATNQQAADMRNEFGRREKALTAIVTQIKDPVNTVRGKILEMEHAFVDPETAGKKLLTGKMEVYILDCRRAKAEAQVAFDRAADRQRSDLAREAEDLMAMGYVDQAESKMRQVQMTVNPVLPDATEKLIGTRTGDKWVAKVTDILALARAIVDGKVPLMHEVKGEMRPLLLVDQVTLNALVSRQQNNLDIPGVAVEEGVRIASAKL